MPTTTVKEILHAELLKVCMRVTTRLRDKHGKKKKSKYTDTDKKKMRELMAAIGWNEDQINKWMEIHSILQDAPELKVTELPLELFCVFVCEQNLSTHRYTVNVPYILTNLNANKGLDLEGLNGTTFASKDNPRYASDDEIRYCIRNLNENQMRFIMSNDIFKPIMNAAMDAEVVVPDKNPISVASEEESHEIQLSDGRKITVAGSLDSN